MNHIINIFAVGDIMLGNQDLCYDFGVTRVIEEKGVDFLFDGVRNILENGDIVFGNLEASLSSITNKSGFDAKLFRCDPAVVFGIKNSYINVLSVANNHIMQHGEEAYFSTINILNENKILPIGVKNEIKILKIKNFNIAIIGYSFIEDNINPCLYNKISSVETIISDISNVRDLVDLVIVSVHWGNEYINYPSPNQVRIGRELIDHGADLILGHHSHVLQGYEIYEGKPIIYGLGNFIFDDTYIKGTEKTVISQILVNMHTRDINVNFIPIISDTKKYFVSVADSDTRKEIFQIISSVRSSIENNSISEYSSYIKDYTLLSQKCHNKAKIWMRVHFMKNIYKYPLNLLINIIGQHIKKKVGFSS
jgi:gamma-polyglutamate biosynthesis protein CapA